MMAGVISVEEETTILPDGTRKKVTRTVQSNGNTTTTTQLLPSLPTTTTKTTTLPDGSGSVVETTTIVVYPGGKRMERIESQFVPAPVETKRTLIPVFLSSPASQQVSAGGSSASDEQGVVNAMREMTINTEPSGLGNTTDDGVTASAIERQSLLPSVPPMSSSESTVHPGEPSNRSMTVQERIKALNAVSLDDVKSQVHVEPSTPQSHSASAPETTHATPAQAVSATPTGPRPKGCCAMCLNYSVSKKPCLSCGRKYCSNCTSSCLNQPQDKCVKCSPGLCVVAIAPETTAGMPGKGCCAMCSQYAVGKRLCMSCGKKFCSGCQLSVMGKETCMKCNPAAYESRLIIDGTCASCQTARGLDSLRCIVCGKRYCAACEQNGLGKTEGMKCLDTCMGQLPHQTLMPVGRQLQCYADVVVNGEALDLVQAWVLLCEPNNVCVHLVPGEWWYDARSGWLGKVGEGPKAIIRPDLHLGGLAMHPQCTGGDTGVFFNGRHINQSEVAKFSMAGVRLTQGEWFFENNGDYGPSFGPDAGQVRGNLWKQGGKRLALALGLVFVGFVGADLLLGAEEGLLDGVSTGAEGELNWSSAATGESVTYTDSGMVGSDGQGGVFFCGKDGESAYFG